MSGGWSGKGGGRRRKGGDRIRAWAYVRSMGGQEDMSPCFLKWRGHLVLCPPTFLGVDIFNRLIRLIG